MTTDDTPKTSNRELRREAIESLNRGLEQAAEGKFSTNPPDVEADVADIDKHTPMSPHERRRMIDRAKLVFKQRLINNADVIDNPHPVSITLDATEWTLVEEILLMSGESHRHDTGLSVLHIRRQLMRQMPNDEDKNPTNTG